MANQETLYCLQPDTPHYPAVFSLLLSAQWKFSGVRHKWKRVCTLSRISFSQISIHFSGLLWTENLSRKYACALQGFLEGVRRCGPFLLWNLNPLFRPFVDRESQQKIRMCATGCSKREVVSLTIMGGGKTTFPKLDNLYVTYYNIHKKAPSGCSRLSKKRRLPTLPLAQYHRRERA